MSRTSSPLAVIGATWVLLAAATAAHAQTSTVDHRGPGQPETAEILDVSQSITQSLDPTVVDVFVWTPCGSGPITTDVTWMRAFDLDGEHGIAGAFCARNLRYAVENVVGNPDVTFAVHCAPQGTSGNLDGFIYMDQLDLQFSTTIDHPDAIGAFFDQSLGGCCRAEESDLVIGVTSEDCLETGNCNQFVFGANDRGQTKPSYLGAPDCGIPDPVDMAMLGFPSKHLVMVVDGAMLSAPVDITQNLEPHVIVDGTSVGEGAGGVSFENAYLRLYDLDAEFGINGDYCTTSVEYGVEAATGGPGGTQPLTLSTYCLDDGLPFVYSSLQLRDRIIIDQPDAQLEFFDQAIGGCCDADTQSLVVEIAAVDCSGTGLCEHFWVGMNDLGQTGPTYIVAPTAGISEPLDLTLVGFPDAALVEVIHGEVGQQAVVTASQPKPAAGSQVATCVSLEMGTSSNSLGSYGATLSWDPNLLSYVGYQGGESPFDAPVVNATDVGTGLLRFSDADPVGATGSVHLFCALFEASETNLGTSPLDLELTSAFTAGTFLDLLPTTTVTDGSANVVPSCVVGDVNGDEAINSGDALVMLSREVGLPIPPEWELRFTGRCGDANGDGVSNSIDANIVLSYEVGLPIDPGFPIGTTNQTSDDCSVCGRRTAGKHDASTVSLTSASREARHRVRESDGLHDLRSPAGEEAGDAEAIVARLRSEPKRVPRGRTFEVTVSVGLPGNGSPLGSYGARLAWDTRAMEYLGVLPGGPATFGSPLINQQEVDEGTLRFSEANPLGASGGVALLRVQFRARRRLLAPTRHLDLDFSSMGSIGPGFKNLLPLLEDQPELRYHR